MTPVTPACPIPGRPTWPRLIGGATGTFYFSVSVEKYNVPVSFFVAGKA